jgi:hypothetical protein
VQSTVVGLNATTKLDVMNRASSLVLIVVCSHGTSVTTFSDAARGSDTGWPAVPAAYVELVAGAFNIGVAGRINRLITNAGIKNNVGGRFFISDPPSRLESLSYPARLRCSRIGFTSLPRRAGDASDVKPLHFTCSGSLNELGKFSYVWTRYCLRERLRKSFAQADDFTVVLLSAQRG